MNLLQQRGIKVKDSDFLQDYARLGKKHAYDPRDKHGLRLSSYWQPNDTIWSVSFKKSIATLETILNPDTYGIVTYKQMRRMANENKTQLLIGSFMFCMPLLILIPYIFPKLTRIRRDYIFQQYLKRRFLQEEFALGNKKISRRQMEQILNEAHQKINL